VTTEQLPASTSTLTYRILHLHRYRCNANEKLLASAQPQTLLGGRAGTFKKFEEIDGMKAI